MEQLNHLADVIKLGKKLVKELELTNSVNTLGRWMAHYIAELIVKVERESSEIKKEKLQKECCEMILKIWSNRKNMPNNIAPLSNFTNALSVLNALNKNSKKTPSWRRYIRDDDHSPWGKFARETSENYDNLIALSLAANLSKEALQKEKEWVEHSELLSAEEKQLIAELDDLLSIDNYIGIQIVFSVDDLNENKENKPDRLTQILNKLSTLTIKQEKDITELKRRLDNGSKEDYSFDEEKL